MNNEDPVSRCGGDDEDVIESEQSHANDVLFFEQSVVLFASGAALERDTKILLRASPAIIDGTEAPKATHATKATQQRLPII